MGKMEIEAAEEFVSVLDRLVKNSDGIAKKAVYKGAGTAADEIKKEIESLPASGIAIQGKKDKRKKIGVLPEEKDDLIKGFGISPVQIIPAVSLSCLLPVPSYQEHHSDIRMIL